MALSALQAAQTFDKPYDHFRLDVFGYENIVRTRLWFYLGQASPETVRAATLAVFRGIAHQVRPFGKCSISHDMCEFGSVEMLLEEQRVSDYTVKNLLARMTALAADVAKQFNLDG